MQIKSSLFFEYALCVWGGGGGEGGNNILITLNTLHLGTGGIYLEGVPK